MKPRAGEAGEPFQRISVEQAKAMMNGRGVQVVDVRQAVIEK